MDGTVKAINSRVKTSRQDLSHSYEGPFANSLLGKKELRTSARVKEGLVGLSQFQGNSPSE